MQTSIWGEGVIPYKSGANFSGAKWPRGWGDQGSFGPSVKFCRFFLRASLIYVTHFTDVLWKSEVTGKSYSKPAL